MEINRLYLLGNTCSRRDRAIDGADSKKGCRTGMYLHESDGGRQRDIYRSERHLRTGQSQIWWSSGKATASNTGGADGKIIKRSTLRSLCGDLCRHGWYLAGRCTATRGDATHH